MTNKGSTHTGISPNLTIQSTVNVTQVFHPSFKVHVLSLKVPKVANHSYLLLILSEHQHIQYMCWLYDTASGCYTLEMLF